VVDPPPDNEPAWEQCMLQGYQHSLPLADIANAIWRGDAIFGSDGSAANDKVLTTSRSSQILLMAHPLLHSNVEAIFRHLLTKSTWIHTALRAMACSMLHFVLSDSS
jgi:hypothetical protein